MMNPFLQIRGLSLHEGAFEVLRDVDHEVAHAFVLVDDVHIVDASLVVVAQTVKALLGHHGIEEGGYPTAKS